MVTKKKRLSKFVRFKLLGRGNYAVNFADGFGQEQGFDTHGPLLITVMPAKRERELRLDDIVHRKSFAELRQDGKRIS